MGRGTICQEEGSKSYGMDSLIKVEDWFRVLRDVLRGGSSPRISRLSYQVVSGISKHMYSRKAPKSH